MLDVSVQFDRFKPLKNIYPDMASWNILATSKDFKFSEEERKINQKTKDRLIVLGAVIVEIVLAYSAVNNFYWFFLYKIPLNIIMAIPPAIGASMISIYLAVILAFYISRRSILRSFKK
jgi:hypothetical protein